MKMWGTIVFWIFVGVAVLGGLFTTVKIMLAHNDSIMELEGQVEDLRSDLGDQAEAIHKMDMTLRKMLNPSNQ